MKVVLSRDEIKKMVAEKFGMNTDNFILEISTENATKSKDERIFTAIVNNNNQVVDMKVENANDTLPPAAVKIKEKAAERVLEKSEKEYKTKIPNKAVVDYDKYALRIEEFLNSTGKTMKVDDLEGLTLAGMEYRIRIAARMYDLNTKIKITKSSKYNELYISKR